MESFVIITIFLGGLITGSAIFWFLRKKPMLSDSEAIAIKEHAAALESQLTVAQSERSKLEAKVTEFEKSMVEIEKDKATLSAQRESLQKQLTQQEEANEKQRAALKLEFENLANKIFEEKSGRFKSETERSLSSVLNPLKENIEQFKKQVNETYQTESREVFALKKEIDRFIDINTKMSEETVNLTKALKGDVKAQGNWGEVVLEKVLEASGLRKGEEYVVQGKDMQLKSADGRIQKPDVIINLPEEKHIVVDSKVSLTHYEQYVSADTDEERQAAVKLFLESIYAHIKNLESKQYHHLDKLVTPEFVLLFFPIEGAFSLAVQNDKNLFNFAWDRTIVIVSPTTLLATLRTVASVWKQERQNKNALRIAVESGRLYDKFVGFSQDLTKIGESIRKTDDNYQAAMNKLKTGTGNIVSRVENIKKLGAKTVKNLPPELLEQAQIDQIEQTDLFDGS